MDCPQGWECDDCLYLTQNECTWEEEVNIQEIADKIEQHETKQVIKDAEVIKSKELKELDEHEKFWRDWARTSPPDSLKQREPINAMSGEIERGGGSKSGKRHKAAKKTIAEYLKTWGT